jgi:hypothetical protein
MRFFCWRYTIVASAAGFFPSKENKREKSSSKPEFPF